jgi:hypothetical protein
LFVNISVYKNPSEILRRIVFNEPCSKIKQSWEFDTTPLTFNGFSQTHAAYTETIYCTCYKSFIFVKKQEKSEYLNIATKKTQFIVKNT